MYIDARGKTGHAIEDYKLGLLIGAVEQLSKIGRTLHARYEMACNGAIDPTECDEEGNDLEAAILQKQADEIAAAVGLYVYHQTDPRGWPLRVSYSPIADNAYDKAAAIDCRSDEDIDEEEI